MSRDEMLRSLRSLRKPWAGELGDCVAGFDLEVASGTGAGTVCCAWGSRAVEGPARMTKRTRALVKAVDLDEDDLPDGMDEDEFLLYKAMIANGCRTGTAYYHFQTSEEGDRYFSTTYERAFEEWAATSLMGAELTPWEEMDDGTLQDWIQKLDRHLPQRKARRGFRGKSRSSTFP